MGMLTNSRFYYSLYKGSGHVAMPTTGVAHLRANGQAKLTVSFVCDNIINTWTLTVQGVDCTLRELAPGWSNLTAASDSLRSYAQRELLAQESGHVMGDDASSTTRASSSSTATAPWIDPSVVLRK